MNAIGRQPRTVRYVPRLLRDLAEDFGDARMLKFAMAFGGRRLYIPVRAHDNHPVAQAAGMDVLRWLCKRHGGELVTFPTGARSMMAETAALVRSLVERGLTVDQIVRQARVHTRTVHRMRERLRHEAQSDLFSRGE